MKRATYLLLFVMAICVVGVSASAADRDVEVVVKAMEARYGIKQTHLPWIASAIIKPAMWGSGAHLGLAIFEDQALPQQTTVEELDQVVRPALGPEWHPVVTVVSKRDGERTVIFARMLKSHMELFIISAERDETSIVKVRLDKDGTQNWVRDPEERGKNNSAKTQISSRSDD